MIREYAVDPEAIYRNLDSLQRFLSDFRAENGRVIAGIPRAWERTQQGFIRQMELGPIARRKCFDEIEIIAKTSVFTGINIPANLNGWINQARHIKNNLALNAIISTATNVAAGEFNYETLLEAEPDDWRVPQTTAVERTAASLASSIEKSLLIASSVLFVDPYFHPTDERYRAPLLEFISKLNGNRGQCKKIYLHTTEQNNRNTPKLRQDILRGLEDHIKPRLPENFAVETWIWPSDQLHDRFVLTKHVGYAFGHGLDEARYQGAINVNINRLAESARKAEFTKFSTAANRLGDPIIIQGEPRS